MVTEQLKQMEHKLACVQFIAEVALIASKDPKDMRIALDIIVFLINSIKMMRQDEDLFYEAE